MVRMRRLGLSCEGFRHSAERTGWVRTVYGQTVQDLWKRIGEAVAKRRRSFGLKQGTLPPAAVLLGNLSPASSAEKWQSSVSVNFWRVPTSR